MVIVLAGIAIASLLGAFGMIAARVGSDPFAQRSAGPRA